MQEKKIKIELLLQEFIFNVRCVMLIIQLKYG
jgi:hypothetical protein